MKLTIELVPSTSFYSNLRSELSTTEWDTIRKKSYEIANNKCEICLDTGKNQGFKHNVECHEIWDYIITEDGKRVQKLLGVISLCPFCHKTKHTGLAKLKGELSIVIKQLMKVNKWSYNTADDYINQCFIDWNEKSKYNWELDISWLQTSNFLK